MNSLLWKNNAELNLPEISSELTSSLFATPFFRLFPSILFHKFQTCVSINSIFPLHIKADYSPFLCQLYETIFNNVQLNAKHTNESTCQLDLWIIQASKLNLWDNSSTAGLQRHFSLQTRRCWIGRKIYIRLRTNLWFETVCDYARFLNWINRATGAIFRRQRNRNPFCFASGSSATSVGKRYVLIHFEDNNSVSNTGRIITWVPCLLEV